MTGTSCRPDLILLRSETKKKIEKTKTKRKKKRKQRKKKGLIEQKRK